METIVFVAIVFVLISILVISDKANRDKSEKRNKVEKYGKAMGDYAHSLADSFAGMASSLTESKEHKKKRIAEETIAEYNSLFLHKQYKGEEPHDPQKEYNDSGNLRKALLEVGMSKEEWIEQSNTLIKLSNILYYKERDKFYENTPDDNQHILKIDNDLKESLAFFKVPEDDWIKFGVNVLVMYGLYVKVENKDD
ncbi:MAG: hypothetical protein IKW89_05730 [Bacteroidales bacterium]|nr:hypothetical protein [Bacteroidales bacterium]